MACPLGGGISRTIRSSSSGTPRPSLALASVILVDVWQWTPFCFLIFLAGLQGIPNAYYEAASIETKNPWAVFRHITLPVLQPTIVLVLLLRITEAFKVFDIPYTMTNGGPLRCIRHCCVVVVRTPKSAATTFSSTK